MGGGLGGGLHGEGAQELTLMERLRGHRTSRENIIHNSGCNPPCPTSHSGCSTCSSCSGGGDVYQDGTIQGSGTSQGIFPSGGGSGTSQGILPSGDQGILPSGGSGDQGILPGIGDGTGEGGLLQGSTSRVIYDPIPSATEISPAEVVAEVAEAAEGSLVVPAANGDSDGVKPVVDPKAFTIETR